MTTTWDLSCRDWAERIRGGLQLVPDLPLDRDEADCAIALFNSLRLPDVRGMPTLAEAGGDWFRAIVAALFGSVDRTTGERFVRELFLLAPKKSSKTTYGAAMMMTAVLMNTRPRAEFLLIAPTKMIADLSFSQAVGMIEADPKGARRFHVQEHLKQITHRTTKAQLKIKAFDSGVLTGVKPVGVLIDELHEIAKDPSAGRVIGQLRGGLLPNPEAFLAFITTQSDSPPAGVFKRELTAARMVRDGAAGGVMLPVLYEFPAEMIESGAWRDPENWWMVTPNRGLSVKIERLVGEFEKAELAGEEEVRRFASQHLNVELGMALQSDRWAGADFWEASGDPTLTLAELIRRSEVATCGIDGGGLDDLLGFAVIGRERGTGNWLAWCRAFAHPVVLQRRKAIAAQLHDFAAADELALVKHIRDDVAECAELVKQIDDAGLLPDEHAVGVDRAGIGAVIDALAARGIQNSEKERIVAVAQGWQMNGAIKTTERKLADGSLIHAVQALMAFCVGNAKVEQRSNAIMITKQVSGYAKIDPLMALFNAAELMSRNPAGRGTSVYNEIGRIQAEQRADGVQPPVRRRDDDNERYWTG